MSIDYMESILEDAVYHPMTKGEARAIIAALRAGQKMRDATIGYSNGRYSVEYPDKFSKALRAWDSAMREGGNSLPNHTATAKGEG